MDSNASRAGEVERKVWRDNDFLLPGKLLKMSPLVDGQSAVSTLPKWGQRRRVATGIRATALLAERASQYLVIVSPSCTEQLRVWPHVPPPFRYSEQHPRHRAVCMGSLFGADPQPPVSGFWGSATSRRLGRVNSSSAAEGRPAVLSRWRQRRLCRVGPGNCTPSLSQIRT